MDSLKHIRQPEKFVGKVVNSTKWVIPSGYATCAMTGKLHREADLGVTFNHHVFDRRFLIDNGIYVEDAEWLSEEGYDLIMEKLDDLGVLHLYRESALDSTIQNIGAPVSAPAPTLEDAQAAVTAAHAVVKCQQRIEDYRRANSTSDTYIVGGLILDVVHWNNGQVKLYEHFARLNNGLWRLTMNTSRETKEAELQAAERQLARLEMAAHLEARRAALAAAAPAAPVAQAVADQPQQIHADQLAIGDVIAFKDERYKVTAVRTKGPYVRGWYEIVDTRAASLSPVHRTLSFEYFAGEWVGVERSG